MRDWSLRTTLIALLLATSVLTFTVVGVLLLAVRLPQIDAENREQVMAESAVLLQLAESFTGGLESRLRTLATLAQTLPLADTRALFSATLREGGFQALYLVRRDGRVLLVETRRPSDGISIEGADFSSLNLFRSALDGNGVAWSDRYPSLRSGEQVVALAMRVGDYVIVGESEHAYVSGAIRDASLSIPHPVIVLDRRGEWLTDNGRIDPHERLRNWDAALFASGGAVQLPLKLADVRYDAAAQRSDRLQWTFVVASPAGMNHQRYAATVWLVFGGLLACASLGTLLAVIWAGRIGKPIHSIIRHTHALAAGDATSSAPRGRIVELNQLASDLDRMSLALEQRRQDLLRSEERLRATLENAPGVAVQWFGEDGAIRYINRASEALLGVAQADAVGKPMTEALAAAGGSTYWQERVACLMRDNEAAPAMEVALRRPDGREAILLATLFACPDAGGGRLLVCMGVDVTLSRQTMRALHASEQRFQSIFDASPLPMAVLRPDSEAGGDFSIVDVNQSWLQRFGQTRDILAGSEIDTLTLWQSDLQRQIGLERMRQACRDGAAEAWFVNADGSESLFEMTAKTAEIGGEELLIWVLNDITDKRRAEQDLRQLNQELEGHVARRTADLEEANRELTATLERLRLTQGELVQADKLAALGGLVAGVAHELNTPIGNGLMAVTTLLDQLRAFQKAMVTGLKRSVLDGFVTDVETGLGIAQRNLQRAAGFVASFKQVAVDQTSSQRRQFELREIVDEILTTMHPMLKRLPYRISVDVPDGLRLDSYPGPLGQVLTNLINNAVMHAFADRDHGNIQIRAQALDADAIRLSVADDGHGIAEEVIDKIFDPFVTTKRGKGGTGLGLHIVYNAVSSVLGGKIVVCSQVGEGAEFVIVIPRIAPAAKVE